MHDPENADELEHTKKDALTPLDDASISDGVSIPTVEAEGEAGSEPESPVAVLSTTDPLLATSLVSVDGKDASNVPDSKGVVILLHGVWVGSWILTLLAQRLRAQGYQVENWGYYSFGASLDQLIPEFATRLEKFQATLAPDVPMFVVAHSLGTIIMRAAVNRVPLPSLQRIVFLSPPNRGSHFATWVGPYLKWLTLLVDELSDREESYVNQLPKSMPENVQVGVIAAEWDHVLSEDTTHLENEVDHIIVPSRHSGLVLRRNAAQQVIHFLEHGRFLHETEHNSPDSSFIEVEENQEI